MSIRHQHAKYRQYVHSVLKAFSGYINNRPNYHGTGCVLVYYEKFFVWLAVVLLLIIVHGDGVKVYCFGLCLVSVVSAD